MKEVNAYLLEDNEYYNEIDSVYYNDKKYMLLVNENNYKDMCIRKLEVRDGEEYILTINSDEFDKVKEILLDKNKSLLN